MVHTATLTYCPASKELFEAFKNADGTQYLRQESRYFNAKYSDYGVKIYAWIDFTHNYYVLYCRVNFQRLISGDSSVDVLAAVDSDAMIAQFNRIMEELQLPLFQEWCTNRIDYCINVRTPNVKTYIKLLQKSDIPENLRVPYDKNRNYAMRPGSLYLVAKARDKKKNRTGSISINFYDKYDQWQKEQATNPLITDELLEQAKDILRLEVQCHKPELEYLKSKYSFDSKSPMWFLSDVIAHDLIMKKIFSICRKGDYLRRHMAIQKIKQSNYRDKTKEEMLSFLKQVNSNYCSIYKTKVMWSVNGYTKEQIRAILKRFDDIGLNPVTISDNAKLFEPDGKRKSMNEGLPNIYDLFEDAFMQEIMQEATETELLNDELYIIE